MHRLFNGQCFKVNAFVSSNLHWSINRWALEYNCLWLAIICVHLFIEAKLRSTCDCFKTTASPV